MADISWLVNRVLTPIHSWLINSRDTSTSTIDSLFSITLTNDIDGSNEPVSVNDTGYAIMSDFYSKFFEYYYLYDSISSSYFMRFKMNSIFRTKRTLYINAHGHSIKNILFIPSSRTLSDIEILHQSSKLLKMFCITTHVIDSIVIQNAVIDNISMTDSVVDDCLTFFSGVSIKLVGCKATNLKIPRFGVSERPIIPGINIGDFLNILEDSTIDHQAATGSRLWYRPVSYLLSASISIGIDSYIEGINSSLNLTRSFISDTIISHYTTYHDEANNRVYLWVVASPPIFYRRILDSENSIKGLNLSDRLLLVSSYTEFDASTENPSPYSPIGCHSIHLKTRIDYPTNIVINSVEHPRTYSNVFIFDDDIPPLSVHTRFPIYGSFCKINNLQLKGYYSDSLFSYYGISLFTSCIDDNQAGSIIFNSLHVYGSEESTIDPVFIYSASTRGDDPTAGNCNIYISIEDSVIETLNSVKPLSDAYDIEINGRKVYGTTYIAESGQSNVIVFKVEENDPAIISPQVTQTYFSNGKICISIDESTSINGNDIYYYKETHLDGDDLLVLSNTDYDFIYDTIKNKDYITSNQLLATSSYQSFRFGIYLSGVYTSSGIDSDYSYLYPYMVNNPWQWNQYLYDGYPYMLTGKMFPGAVYNLFAGDIKPLGFIYNNEEISTFYIGDEQVWGLFDT